MSLLLTLTILVTFTLPAHGASVSNSDPAGPCHVTAEVCEFWLDISHQRTMIHDWKAVYADGGKLYYYDVTNTSAADPVDPSHVIVADGWEEQRLVVVANGSLPGPKIEVSEGQTVVVHVRNLMASTAVTVHWHGQHQVATPWMDGVAHVTQCPIQPLASFTYKFKASPAGTFWYHSHIGSQFGWGLIGPLVVRKRSEPDIEEFTVMVQEWSHHEDPDTAHASEGRGSFINRELQPLVTWSHEGSAFNSFLFTAGLINGRGRYVKSDGSHSGTPLTTFKVVKGRDYRFRVVGASVMYPFRVSVDGHLLTVVASDGYDIEPVVAESVIISSGERYDFLLSANQSASAYWLRAETLEVGVVGHEALAVVQYQGHGEAEPTSSRRQCTRDDRCVVVNCPFLFYGPQYNLTCLTLADLRSRSGPPTPGGDLASPEPVHDVFLNFAVPGPGEAKISSVNGRRFTASPVSALTQPQELGLTCDPDLCGEEKICNCPYSIDLEHGKVYQFIFTNMGKGRGMTHPIHMHGHSFHVVKVGFPPYDQDTGRTDFTDNTDINCNGNPDPMATFCNSPSWRNSSWGGNDVPGLHLERPIVKDTVNVPTGGYVVVRVRADNPGLWFLHCHIELHATLGMALLLNESFTRQAPPPAGFPRCGDFRLTALGNRETQPENDIAHIATKLNNMENKLAELEDDDDAQLLMLKVLVAVSAVAVVQLTFLCVVACRSKKSS